MIKREETDLFCLRVSDRGKVVVVSLSAGNDQEWTSGYSRHVPSTMSVKRLQQKELPLASVRALCWGGLNTRLCCIRQLITFVHYQGIDAPSTIASHIFRRTV